MQARVSGWGTGGRFMAPAGSGEGRHAESTREDPFCGEGANCFRTGTGTEGSARIAVAGQEDRP